MAITIQDAPINYSPVYSPCIYVVKESTLTSQTDFRYICEIYLNGAKVVELKAFAHPTYGWGKFDISSVLQQYVETPSNFTADVYSSKEIVIDAEVRFGYSYINSSGAAVRSPNLTRQTRTYFNGSPFYDEFTALRDNPSQHPYLITQGTVYEKYPLTSRRSIETARGTKQWLTYLPDAYTYVDRLEVDDLIGPTINNIYVPTALENATDGKAYTFRIDPEAIEAQTSFTNLERYRVRTKNNISGATSEWINVEVLPCYKWSVYSLYYLNRWGGIDSFSMDGRSVTTYGAKSETYRVDTETVDASGTVNYDESRHSTRNYHTEQLQVYALTSSWVNHSSKKSAVDLQASPQVWLETPDNVILPVEIEQESFELIDNNNNEPIHLAMSVRYTQPVKRQKI